jgi:hypothetical protein
MTKKEFDKLTKQHGGARGLASDERHYYRTNRMKPSHGSGASGPNELFLMKPDKLAKKVPGTVGYHAALRKIGMKQGVTAKTRQVVFDYEHPLPLSLVKGSATVPGSRQYLSLKTRERKKSRKLHHR